jgi:hypothetical protein
MAHFAQISDRNVVLQVLVIADTDCLDESGTESESVGIDYCKSLFGADTRWVQTSYTSRIRGVYASVGFIYDPVADIFYDPFCNPPKYLTE